MIPDFIKPYLAVAAAILLTVAATYATYIYKDRQRLQADLGRIEDQIERNKKQAADLLSKREQENADLAEKWRNYARESDDSYEKKIAALRANGSSGLRVAQGCGGGGSESPAGQTAANSTGTPEKAPAGQGTLHAGREFTFGEVELSTMLGWYVYAESCHAAINRK